MCERRTAIHPHMENRSITKNRLCAFAAFLQKEEKSPATVEKYLREVQRFAAWLAEGGLEVNKEAVTAYKEELLNKGFCPATVNGKLTALDRLFGFLGWEGCKVKHLKVPAALPRARQRADPGRIRTAGNCRKNDRQSPFGVAARSHLRHRHPRERGAVFNGGGGANGQS